MGLRGHHTPSYAATVEKEVEEEAKEAQIEQCMSVLTCIFSVTCFLKHDISTPMKAGCSCTQIPSRDDEGLESEQTDPGLCSLLCI